MHLTLNLFSNIKNWHVTIKTVNSDLEREKSISLDADLNEKRILKEKEELFKTENKLLDIEVNSSKELQLSKAELNKLQSKLDKMLDKIEDDIDQNIRLSKDTFRELKQLVKKITLSQEEYAEKYGKNKSIESDSIKRKERIKNIDIELENWGNLKSNSEKMIAELNNRSNKIKLEIGENQKNPERIATSKGQNIQNLENIKKRNEEIESELIKAEKKYSSINENLREIQLKLTELKESKARNEATVEGIENRKKDLLYSAKNELNIDNEISILPQSDLNQIEDENFPTIDQQIEKIEKIKKQRESLGSVNLRADEETKKFETEIRKMEDDRADLYSAIVRLKASIDAKNGTFFMQMIIIKWVSCDASHGLSLAVNGNGSLKINHKATMGIVYGPRNGLVGFLCSMFSWSFHHSAIQAVFLQYLRHYRSCYLWPLQRRNWRLYDQSNWMIICHCNHLA